MLDRTLNAKNIKLLPDSRSLIFRLLVDISALFLDVNHDSLADSIIILEINPPPIVIISATCNVPAPR